MKLLIEPTEHFFMAGDVMVRMWTGTDDKDQPLIALVTCIAYGGQAEIAVEGLVSIPPPDAEAAQRWAAKVMSSGSRGK